MGTPGARSKSSILERWTMHGKGLQLADENHEVLDRRRQVADGRKQSIVGFDTRKLSKLALRAPVDGKQRLLGTERREVRVIAEGDVGAIATENQTLRRVVRRDTPFVRERSIDFIDDEHCCWR